MPVQIQRSECCCDGVLVQFYWLPEGVWFYTPTLASGLEWLFATFDEAAEMVKLTIGDGKQNVTHPGRLFVRSGEFFLPLRSKLRFRSWPSARNATMTKMGSSHSRTVGEH